MKSKCPAVVDIYKGNPGILVGLFNISVDATLTKPLSSTPTVWGSPPNPTPIRGDPDVGTVLAYA